MLENGTTFSDPLKAALAAAGWTASRCVDTRRVVRVLSRRGYVVHDAAVHVLQQFAGLRFEVAHEPDRDGTRFSHRFRIVGGWRRFPTFRRTFRGWLRGNLPADAAFLRWRFNWDACPIGSNEVYYMGCEDDGQIYSLESGRVIWCDADWEWLLLANDFVALVDFICFGRGTDVEHIVLDTEENNRKLIELGILG